MIRTLIFVSVAFFVLATTFITGHDRGYAWYEAVGGLLLVPFFYFLLSALRKTPLYANKNRPPSRIKVAARMVFASLLG